ncbi:periplasmic nitrate reductase, NapE protein [Mesorhizobium sp. ANAO-SY3R2]|uniref:periplasmic nitrate reductase, NapE protein n=1 Tax=Mesorhizobium sp. ANAO-SY3R2 TaxID=3166644 RepID=UPI00366DD596
MASGSVEPATEPVERKRRRWEQWAFLVLAFVIWPFIAVGFVATYGFIVWMWQAWAGPPGPPGG